MKSFALFSVAFTLLIASVHAQDAYSFKENYLVSTPASLSISSSDGNIEIGSSSNNQIEVFYFVRKGPKLLKIDRKDLEREHILIEVKHDRNNLHILVKYGNEERMFDWDDQVRVNFVIRTPEQTACTLHTSDGNVSVSGLTGDQECKTSDGNIRLNGIVGNVVATTSDGNVSGERIHGDMEIRTSDGDIDLNEVNGRTLARTSDGSITFKNLTGSFFGTTSDGNVFGERIGGTLEIKTSDGDIDLNEVNGGTSVRTSDGNITFKNLAGSFSGATSDGNIRGNILKLGKELAANTGGGNISVTIPDRLGLDLDIHGESLDVPLTNFTGSSDKKSIKGKANGGGIAVNLRASDGHVSLAYKN
jgi:DUF4097 and DUF4098 domain-containing protein YvlB